MRIRKWRSAAARRICQFTRTNQVEAAVTEIGRRLLDGVTVPPTDLDAVMAKLRIVACVPDPEMMFSGELRPSPDGLTIAYSPNQTVRRCRFTIAHEIGHAVFERTGRYVPHRGRELEDICDMIASELLMPEAAFRDVIRAPITLREISRAASIFQISLTAAAIRCAKSLDCTVALLEDDEISWLNAPYGRKNCGLREQIRDIAVRHSDDDRGEAEFPLIVDEAKPRMAYLQWRTTGLQGRKLLVLSEVPDQMMLPEGGDCEDMEPETTAVPHPQLSFSS